MTDRRGAAATAAAVNAGKTSAVAVAEEAIARIAAYDAVQPQIWISRATREELVAAARDIDARVAAGEILPLAGVPFAVKDNIDVAGFDTTAACPAFAYRPHASAAVIERLLAAGALCVGKTNLDQFATGLNGTRSPYGSPRNAYNLAYVSGGSSSGSSVAVAAGLVPFALGTDTAGSGRVPAAFQHLVGFKPTKGRWSTRGLVPACRTLDCITVFTADTADARLVDQVIAAFDPADPYSRKRADRPLGRKTIGVPRRDQRVWFGDAESEYLYDRSLETLAGLAEIVEVDLAPLKETAQLLYSGPWVAERTAAMAGILADNPDAVDAIVRAVVEPGAAMSAVELFNGIYRLAELRRHADMLWADIDMLAFPTTGTTYRVAELLAAPVALNSNLGFYTNFVNLLDMAALAVPAGIRANATGFGITLIGPADSDVALLDAADAYISAADLPSPPPLDLEGKMQTVKLAVVGAHLKDMPLHWQLTSREAKFVGAFETAPTYRLYAMADSVPPKPALVHSEDGGAIAVEVYELGVAEFGSFVVEVPAPLAIGTVTLADGSSVKGFVAEPRAQTNAEDITSLGGWRAYIARARLTTDQRQPPGTKGNVMQKLRGMVMAMAAGCASIATAAGAQTEQVITVPGFADFLAVDGDTVWATNHGRVERWSRQGKLAEVPMSKPCGGMVIFRHSLWVADCKDGTVIRIDTRTAQKTATIATGIANPAGELNVVAGAGSIWVATEERGVVARIDPRSNSVAASITVDPGTYYLAFGHGSLWAVSAKGQSVQRIDPRTNAVMKRTELGKEPGFLAAGAGAVWVQEQGDGTVARIDRRSGEVSGRVKVGEVVKYGDIDTGGRMVWLRTTEDQTFAVIDPKTMTVLKRVGKPEGSGALRYTRAGLWTSAHDIHTLTWWPKPAQFKK